MSGVFESRHVMRHVPLSEAVEINPKADRSQFADDMPVSFVPMAAVGAANGQIDASDVRPYREVKKGYTHFCDGDVLFAKVTPCMENGKMAVARQLKGGLGFGSTEFHVLRPRDGVDPHYVYHFVSSQTFRKEAARHMTGAVGLRRVPTAFLETAAIPLPDIDAQRCIVAEIEKQFSRLDEAVANLQRVKANLKRYKISVLQAVTSGTLSPDRGSEPDTKGWRWLSIADLASAETRSIQSGPFGSNLLHSEFQARGKLVIGIDNVHDGVFSMGSNHRISEEKFQELAKYAARPRDVLITVMGTVGRVCVVPETIEPAIITKHVYRISIDRELAIPEYVGIALRGSRDVRMQLRASVRGQTRPGLNGNLIKRIRMLVPSLEHQSDIVAEVDRRLSTVREVEAEVDANLKRAQALRQSVLQRAFSATTTARQVRSAKLEPVQVILAARIIAANHVEATFGRTALMKAMFVATHHARLEAANDQYVRMQAGPLDMAMLETAVKRLNDLGWFREVRKVGRTSSEIKFSYEALTKADDYKQHLGVFSAAQLKVVDDVGRLMRKWTTEECELFATVYAAWNDLLLTGRDPTVEAIVHELHARWHESKRRFSTARIEAEIVKLRTLGYAPTGFGRPTAGSVADTYSADLFGRAMP